MIKKLKPMQNSETKEIWKTIKGVPIYAKVVTTMTRLVAYIDGNIVGEARVIRAEDFDYQALLAIAKEKSGSKIEVA